MRILKRILYRRESLASLHGRLFNQAQEISSFMFMKDESEAAETYLDNELQRIMQMTKLEAIKEL